MKNMMVVVHLTIFSKIRYNIPKWFLPSWYKYLFAKRDRWCGDAGLVRTFICRARNHPAGVVWYNPNGFEPDMHCKNCGDDLG